MPLADFSKAKACLLLLSALMLGLSVAMLGLAAHALSFYYGTWPGGNWNTVRVHVFTYNATTSNSTGYATNLSYAPSPGLDMGDQFSLLVAGVLGAILAVLLLLGVLWKGTRTVNISLSGRTVRPARILGNAMTLALDVCLLLLFLVIASYSWSQASSSIKYLDSSNVATPSSNFTWYNRQGDFTFEHWNCALSYIAADGLTASKLFDQCKQAEVARVLALVLFLLALVRLALHFWAWRRHNIAVRLGAAAGYRSGEVRLKDESRLSSAEHMRRDDGSVGRRDEVVELPAYRLSRVEAPDEGVGEMPGENGSKELPGATVAVEMDGQRNGRDETG